MDYLVQHVLPLFLVLLLIVLIHESGHLILGVLSGGKLERFCLGNIHLGSPILLGKLHIYPKYLSFLFSGYCEFSNLKELPLRSQWWIALGGSLFNIVTGIIAFCISLFVSEPFFFFLFSCASISNGIAQIKFYNDGIMMKEIEKQMNEMAA